MMTGFAGTHAHSLDTKGRVIIPASFRTALGDGFTLALNSSIDALALYPAAKWEAVNEQLARVRDTDDEGMDYMRYIMAHADTDLSLDTQGRLLLPQNLRDTVGLSKDLIFAGLRDHIEIWSAAVFTQKNQDARTRFASLRKHVNDTY